MNSCALCKVLLADCANNIQQVRDLAVFYDVL